MKNLFVAGVMAVALSACQSSSKPEAEAANFDKLTVPNFNAQRYMGRWYEVARFDFKFQKDLKNVTADYSIKSNGDIEVINQGVNIKTGKAQKVKGVARFNGPTDYGALKVSFFANNFSQYNVVGLDNQYQYALVFGETRDNIWLLSRQKTMPDDIKKVYLQFAAAQGYDLNRLVWTTQE